MRGKKTGGVDDLSLVRFPWQLLFQGVFDQILLKTAKNYRFRDTSPTLCLFVFHIFRTIGFSQISTDLLFIKLGLANIWLILVDSKQSYA